MPEARFDLDDATKLLLAHKLVDRVRARVERKLARAANLSSTKRKRTSDQVLHPIVYRYRWCYRYFGVGVNGCHDAIVGRLQRTLDSERKCLLCELDYLINSKRLLSQKMLSSVDDVDV